MTHHDHSDCGCGCGHQHSHEHSHTHHHEEAPAKSGCGGGCCGGGGANKCCSGGEAVTFTQREREFLMELMERQFLPMAQLVVKSTISHDFEMVALSPVYLESPKETMAEIKTTGEMLHKLEGLGLLTLDFDEPLDAMSYEMYEQSDIFAYLKETVALGKEMGRALGDTPVIEQGSIAVTPLCLHRFAG